MQPEKNGTYNPTSYLNKSDNISFDMLGSNFGPDYRDLRCMDSNVN